MVEAEAVPVPSAEACRPIFALYVLRATDMLALRSCVLSVATAMGISHEEVTAAGEEPEEDGETARPSTPTATLRSCLGRLSRASDAVVSFAATHFVFQLCRASLLESLYSPTPTNPASRLSARVSRLSTTLSALSATCPAPLRSLFLTRALECACESWARALLFGGPGRSCSPANALDLAGDVDALEAGLAATGGVSAPVISRLLRPLRTRVLPALALPTTTLIAVLGGKAAIPKSISEAMMAAAEAKADEPAATEADQPAPADGEATPDDTASAAAVPVETEAEEDASDADTGPKLTPLVSSKALQLARLDRMIAALVLLRRKDQEAIGFSAKHKLPQQVASSMGGKPQRK
jgi:hypothetical protein